MEIYLVRHGETVWNREGRYYGKEDVPLSEEGIRQAKELGNYLRQITFDKVICSPLRRAKDTARELTEQSFYCDDRLEEQSFGIFEGKTYKELRNEYPNELEQWNANYESYCIPEGESFRMVRDRVEAFAKELWQEEGKILIVAHKGTFGHLLAALMYLPLAGYWNFAFEQGTYSKIDLQDGFAILRAINRMPDIISAEDISASDPSRRSGLE